MDTAFRPKNGVVFLPKKGSYFLWKIGSIVDSGIIVIRDTGLTIVRFKEHKIQEFNTGAFDALPIYVTCGIAINGYQDDFYPNGNFRIRGNFKEGRFTDSLITFYPNGKIEKRIYKYPKVVNIEEYDSLGHIVQISHNQNKSFMEYWEHEWIKFYPNGQIKSKESSKKRIITIEEFYPSGKLQVRQTKKTRDEYFENGIKMVTYKWSAKRKWGGRNPTYNLTVTKNSYDDSGQILTSVVYEDWSYSTTQPKLEVSGSDWIISSRKYKQGAVVFNVEEMETKEYLKKYSND